MIRANGIWATLLALCLAMGIAPAHAQTFPALTGRVVDAANIIPDDREAALDAKLAALETASGHQLVVATVPNLEGYDIADYGYRLGRAWAVGQAKINDGALLIVAPNERRVRIEVGYGLEPVLTDAFSSVIINTQITPRFKAGDYPGGIDAGVDAIAEQIKLPPEEAAKRAAQMAAAEKKKHSDFNPGSLIFWGFIFLFFILPMLRGTRGRRHSSGIGEAILWGALSNISSGRGGGGSSWGGGGGGGFSGGGGSFGGGGASGGW